MNETVPLWVSYCTHQLTSKLEQVPTQVITGSPTEPIWMIMFYLNSVPVAVLKCYSRRERNKVTLLRLSRFNLAKFFTNHILFIIEEVKY